ncbi:hypothetical protein NM208_g6360 [Fusarium decemcellulare]|uniref:Uncharacterized protein n=1 Tax=Fusarium decemcellulare TaxID=57161 RepID=A0ACC1SDM3_9HYPO|nr:hypothetical protein NM208_g6360 [Fusarium decemcellulare]
MDLLDELEAMAQTVSLSTSNEIHDATVHTWQTLFGYSRSEAIERIKQYRQYRQRPHDVVISDSHWEMVRQQKESEGFDREAYEYSCGMANRRESHEAKPTDRQLRKLQSSSFLVKLEGPLSSIAAVAEATNITRLSEQDIIEAIDTSGQPSFFCQINGINKLAIEEFLSNSATHSGVRPTFIRDSRAKKDLSVDSIYPTLGTDSTIPQYRLRSDTDIPRPAQNEYPVWCFFYGTLAESSVLSKLLDIQPIYVNARIVGGVMKSWGKYNALIDDSDAANILHGKAFLVENKDQEDTLRVYETDAYEVVRCCIEMEAGESVNGLTFRFIEDAMN